MEFFNETREAFFWLMLPLIMLLAIGMRLRLKAFTIVIAALGFFLVIAVLAHETLWL